MSNVPISDDWIALDWNCNDDKPGKYMAFWQVLTHNLTEHQDLTLHAYVGYGDNPERAIQSLIIQSNLQFPTLKKSRTKVNVHDLTDTMPE